MIHLPRGTSSVFAFALAIAIAIPLVAQSGVNPAKTSLLPGDRILLRLYVDSSFNYSDAIIIDQATRVVLPRLGSVSLQGVPAESVADSVRSAYASILRTKAIDVIPLRRVGIVGDVRKPDVYYIDLTTNLRDAIALAGGVAEIGRRHNVSITIRNGVTTRVKDWENSASVWSALVSGDEILVGRQSFFERNAIAVITGISVFASIVFTLARK